MLPWLVAVIPPSFGDAGTSPGEPIDVVEVHEERRVEPPVIEYGAGIVAGVLLSSGGVCQPDPSIPCVLDSGGGLAVHFGYSPRPLFRFGLAYEVSKHDAHKVLALAILQQVRAEARLRLVSQSSDVPYLVFGAGVSLYGSSWAADTGGPALLGGLGLEFLLSPTSAIDVQLSYRGIGMSSWTDPTGTARPSGMASLFALEIGFEHLEPTRDPTLPTSP